MQRRGHLVVLRIQRRARLDQRPDHASFSHPGSHVQRRGLAVVLCPELGPCLHERPDHVGAPNRCGNVQWRRHLAVLRL
eukprot:3615765-Prymnesium_polylepis.3